MSDQPHPDPDGDYAEELRQEIVKQFGLQEEDVVVYETDYVPQKEKTQ